ncbi:MAG: MerR family transcriptional regulator [Actinomycetota bacterium]|nr:MerR family transcriptional regulator [Actinomycetota bacterium]
MGEGAYKIKEAAELTGVTPELLRSWERRYGVPLPKRSPSGHRLYSEEDVRAVRWIRKKTDWGMGVRRAVELFKGGGSAPGAQDDLEAVRYTLLDHLLAGEEGKAGAVLEGAVSGHGVESVCVEVVEPVLVLVGELWHRGVIGVVHEHLITESLKSVLIRLLAEEKKTGPDGVKVIVGCAPEELHEMGLLMLALFLARRGFDVLYLGQAVPLDDLGVFAAGFGAKAVFLSASHKPRAKRMLRELPRLEAASGAQVFVGGSAFEDESLREAAVGRFLGGSVREAADVAAELLLQRST